MVPPKTGSGASPVKTLRPAGPDEKSDTVRAPENQPRLPEEPEATDAGREELIIGSSRDGAKPENACPGPRELSPTEPGARPEAVR